MISIWVGNPSKDPIAYVNGQPTAIGAPSYAYWARPGQGSSYNVYVVHSPSLNDMGGWGGKNFDPTLYPSQAAMADLFGPQPSDEGGGAGVGVSQEAFFTGIDPDGSNNGWENLLRRPIAPLATAVDGRFVAPIII